MLRSIIWSLVICAAQLVVVHGNHDIDFAPSAPRRSIKHLRGVAYLSSEDGSVQGRLRLDQFFQKNAPTHIYGNVTGLSPGSHGIAIATWGNLTEQCDSIGAHFNPDLMAHGAPYDKQRHVGDLGNIQGEAPVDIVDNKVSLFGRNSVMGRSVVVYMMPDDLGKSDSPYSLIHGNAAPVVACGVIGRSFTDEFY